MNGKTSTGDAQPLQGSKAEGVSTCILNDLPTECDAPDFEPYADTLKDIIASPSTHTPLTIGVFGTWGSGKTSLMRMIQKTLPEGCSVAWFDPWKYGREETLWRALLLRVLATLRAELPQDDSEQSKKALAELNDLETALYCTVAREEVGGVQIDWGELAAGPGQGAVQIGLSFIPGGKVLGDLVKKMQEKGTEAATENLVAAIRRERSKIRIEHLYPELYSVLKETTRMGIAPMALPTWQETCGSGPGAFSKIPI